MPSFTGELATLMDFLGNPANVIVAHLGKNPMQGDVERIRLADLVEADFVGYAPVPVTDCLPVDYEDDLYGEAVSPEIEFVSQALAAPQTVYTVYVTLQAGAQPTMLLAVVVLPKPFTFAKLDDRFAWSWRFASADLDSMPTDLAPL